MSTTPSVEAAWRNHRPHLVNLAYQMLGDVGAAEDVTQEAFLRLAGATDVDDVRAWLTVVTGRLCMDQLRSARSRYEDRDAGGALEAAVSAEPDPADRVTLDDEVHTALWEMLRRLSPAERVAFVLHDVFQMPFDQIAGMVGRPVGTCRQLARRARGKFEATGSRLSDVVDADHRRVTDAFITACFNGDLEALTAVLDPTVWGIATFLGDAAPHPQINHGRDAVAPNLLRFLSPATLVTGPAGHPVVFAFIERRLVVVLVLTLRDNKIIAIESTVDLSAAGNPGVAL